MGKAQQCQVQWGSQAGMAEVHLDSTTITLRGAVQQRWLVADGQHWRIDAGALCAEMAGQTLRLELGERIAKRWLKAIIEPPSLAQKLGLPGANSSVHFDPNNATLAEFFAELAISPVAVSKATLCFVEVSEHLQWLAALALAKKLTSEQMLWVLRVKGKQALISESTIMSGLAEIGFKPNKTTAWNERHGADRYVRGKTEYAR